MTTNVGKYGKGAAMHRLVVFLVLGCFAIAAVAEPIVLTAADGVKVFGVLSRAPGAHPPVILAFHQAGSNHAEYASLAPRLNAAGFTVLAIDQRSGGNMFGGTNQTVAGLGRSTSYDAALPDLVAALAWGKAAAGGAPVIVWGSSYSAALVFLLAAQNAGVVSGVLLFRPGNTSGEVTPCGPLPQASGCRCTSRKPATPKRSRPRGTSTSGLPAPTRRSSLRPRAACTVLQP